MKNFKIKLWKFSGVHDQGSENVCWAYAISTMIRASIRSLLKKYKIENGLEILDDPNHHKMMCKQLTMNIFPFGNDGTDPFMVIKLVCIMKFSYLFMKSKNESKQNFLSWQHLLVYSKLVFIGFTRSLRFWNILTLSPNFLFTRSWQARKKIRNFIPELLKKRLIIRI